MLPTQPPRGNRLLCALTWPGTYLALSPPPLCSLAVLPVSSANFDCISRSNFNTPQRAMREWGREGWLAVKRKRKTENRNAQRFFNCHVLRVACRGAGGVHLIVPCLAAKCGIITQSRDWRARTPPMPMTNYEMFDFPGDTKRDEYFVQAEIPLTRWLYTLDAPFFVVYLRWQKLERNVESWRRSCSEEIFNVKWNEKSKTNCTEM